MIVLLILIKNNVVTVKDITSAIGKAHHTAWSPPSLERMYAAGIKTTSCRMIDTIMEKTAFPKAWNTVPTIIQNHAMRK